MSSFSKSKNSIHKKALGYSSAGSIFFSFLMAPKIKWLLKSTASQGDEIHYHAIDELFSGKYDALTVIKLRDIHKDIENALDSCFSVSDAVVNVVLKQS